MQFKIAGQVVGFDEQGNLTVNDKSPASITELGGQFYKVSSYLYRRKKPKKVNGSRKRKQALNVAIKKYCFSFIIKKEM